MADEKPRHIIKALVNEAQMGPLISYLTSQRITFTYQDASEKKAAAVQAHPQAAKVAATVPKARAPQQFETAPPIRTVVHGTPQVIPEFINSHATYVRLSRADINNFLVGKDLPANNLTRTLYNFHNNGLIERHRDGTYSKKVKRQELPSGGGNIKPPEGERAKKVYQRHETTAAEFALAYFYSKGKDAEVTPGELIKHFASSGRNPNTGRLILWHLLADNIVRKVPTAAPVKFTDQPYRLA